MSPGKFRDLPSHEQIEMMAHRREVNWRESHRSHVEQMVAKQEAEADTDAPGTRGKRPVRPRG